MNGSQYALDRWISNPLVRGISAVCRRVQAFKEVVRAFYYSVSLSACHCPRCGGRLTMTAPGECCCECGAKIDPTIEFQRSDCCDVALRRRTCHYVCSACLRVVPSKFLFDEAIFDREYFKTKMRESRERTTEAHERLVERMLQSRSSELLITETPEIAAIPGLGTELDRFVGAMGKMPLSDFLDDNEFHMEQYRRAILEDVPPGCLIRFSAIPPVDENQRRDRTRRFVTLIFMEQAREVALTQENEDILVERYEINGERC